MLKKEKLMESKDFYFITKEQEKLLNIAENLEKEKSSYVYRAGTGS